MQMDNSRPSEARGIDLFKMRRRLPDHLIIPVTATQV